MHAIRQRNPTHDLIYKVEREAGTGTEPRRRIVLPIRPSEIPSAAAAGAETPAKRVVAVKSAVPNVAPLVGAISRERPPLRPPLPPDEAAGQGPAGRGFHDGGGDLEGRGGGRRLVAGRRIGEGDEVMGSCQRELREP